jgi:two-component system, OmpR family, sensor kinase
MTHTGRRSAILIAFVPLVLCAVIAAVLRISGASQLIVFARADLATLFLLVGLAGSSVLSIASFIHMRSARQQQAALDLAHSVNEIDRRRFLQRLDHELKNPLTAVRAGLANLGSDGQINQAEVIAGVESQVVRLSRLTADLRKLADLAIRELDRDPIDVGELLQEIAEIARERPEANGRRVLLTLPQIRVLRITGDRDLLLLALFNLVDNALKYTQAGDTIELRAFEDRRDVVIEVADTGPGIAESDQAHVWEELYRGRSAEGTAGSGIGMALVRAICIRHAGSAELRSEIGEGTVVSVRLPQ